MSWIQRKYTDQLNNYEISPFEQLYEKLLFFTLKITHSLAPIIMKY